MNILVTIAQTSSSQPGEGGCFNKEIEKFQSLEEVFRWLEGKFDIDLTVKPTGIFKKLPNGERIQTGLLYRQLRQSGRRSWWEQDYVTFEEILVTPFTFPEHLQVAE